MGPERDLLGRDAIAIERLDCEAIGRVGGQSSIDADFHIDEDGATALQSQVVVPSLQIVPGRRPSRLAPRRTRSLHWFVQGTPDHEQSVRANRDGRDLRVGAGVLRWARSLNASAQRADVAGLRQGAEKRW